jgi:ATP-dependent DNA helicase RecG
MPDRWRVGARYMREYLREELMSTARIIPYPEVSNFSDQVIRGILLQLCSQPATVVESEELEIKSWCSDEKQLADKTGEAAACLANACGGILLIGVADDDKKADKFSPCPYRNVTATWIAQRIRDLTMPPVEMTVRDVSYMVREVSGAGSADAFAVLIPKTKRLSGHITVGGVSKIRSGKECRPHYSVEEDFSKAPDSTLAVSDLSLDSIHWGIEGHQRRFKVPAESFDGPTDFLVRTGLVERYFPENDACPSYRVSLAAALLFGKKSAVGGLSFEVIITSAGGSHHYRRNIVETYKELCGTSHAVIPTLCAGVPVETVRELLVNAFIHRSYRTNGPIIVRIAPSSLQIESPGELPVGLHADSLIHCVPVYRNFLLAEGARYLGLCDKIGQGIDLIYSSALENGFGFPSFESRDGRVTARVPTSESKEFREFVRKRSQSLNQLDELIVLRLLWDKERASGSELYSLMQRGPRFGQEVLDRMFRKTMIEPVDGARSVWRLEPVLRKDIQTIFQADQMNLGLDLFGDGSLYAERPRE